jgi:hypothetical protein
VPQAVIAPVLPDPSTTHAAPHHHPLSPTTPCRVCVYAIARANAPCKVTFQVGGVGRICGWPGCDLTLPSLGATHGFEHLLVLHSQ